MHILGCLFAPLQAISKVEERMLNTSHS
jgi:hypothetical protein